MGAYALDIRISTLYFKLSPYVEVFPDENNTGKYICSIDHVKSRKSFLIGKEVFDVIEFCREPKTREEIKFFSIQLNIVNEKGFERFFSEFLVQKGIIKDKMSEEALVLSSSLLKIKLRLLSPNIINMLVKPLTLLLSFRVSFLLMLVFFSSFLHIAYLIYSDEFAIQSAALGTKDSIAVIFLICAGLIFHELGHAAAAYKYGCRKVEVGVGWYIYFIVFYAELSEAWRLKPEKRLVIDCAGGYFQSVFGVVLWCAFLNTGNFVFISAASLLMLYSLFNLNPFFRMDGYWIASDLLGVTNLRAIAFSIIKTIFTKPKQFFKDFRCGGQISNGVFGYAMLMLMFYIWFSYYVYSSLFPTSLKFFYTISIAVFLNEYSAAELAISLIQLLWHGLIIYFVIYFSISMLKKTVNTIRLKYHASN